MELKGTDTEPQLNSLDAIERPPLTDAIHYTERDGEMIMEAVLQSGGEDYAAYIKAHPFPAVLYHLADLRANLVRGMAIGKGERVMEIGSGCGALTKPLAERAGEVIALETSLSQCRIARERLKKSGCINVQILCGGIREMLQKAGGGFDRILLSGSFFSALQGWIEDSESASDFLRELKSRLSSSGQLFLSVPNRLGLKFFAAWNELESGRPYEGIHGYMGHSLYGSYSKSEWIRLLHAADLESFRFYYPFPDERYPLQFFTEEYPPHLKGLLDNERNLYEGSLTFDVNHVYRHLDNTKLFFELCNGFVITADKSPSENKESRLLYEKFSTERSPEFSMLTGIRKIKGKREVFKRAARPEAEAHLESLEEKEGLLIHLYQDTPLLVNSGTEREDERGAAFDLEYVSGKNHEECLEQILETEGSEEGLRFLEEHIELVLPKAKRVPFTYTEEFQQIFGELSENVSERQKQWEALPAADIDLILSNVIDTEKGKVLIDYEWTFAFPVPVPYLIYRVINYFFHVHNEMEGFSREELFRHFHLSPEEVDGFIRMERKFQNYIEGGHKPLRNIQIRRRASEETGDREDPASINRSDGHKPDRSDQPSRDKDPKGIYEPDKREESGEGSGPDGGNNPDDPKGTIGQERTTRKDLAKEKIARGESLLKREIRRLLLFFKQDSP